MSFEIRHLHIESDSPEGQGLQAIIDRDHVTPEEAVRKVLREALIRANPAKAPPRPSYASLFGAVKGGLGAHGSSEAVDRYITELRDAW